jgi:hypothetical protein
VTAPSLKPLFVLTSTTWVVIVAVLLIALAFLLFA